MIELQRAGQGPAGLIVGHLNHGLRGPEAQADADFVRAQAARRELTVVVGTVDVAAEARRTGESLETTARSCRYRFLIETARRCDCPVIALGHTADDNVETILHHILRGTGLRGLAGMARRRRADELADIPPAERPWLVRPLLRVTRRQVEDYLRERHVPWREDTSNIDPAYTRNRIRHELLPWLREQFNPAVDRALLRLAAAARDVDALLVERSRQALDELLLSETPEAVELDAARMVSLPRWLQGEVLRRVVERQGWPRRHLGRGHLVGALEVLAGGKAVSWPGRVEVRRVRGVVRMVRHGPGGT